MGLGALLAGLLRLSRCKPEALSTLPCVSVHAEWLACVPKGLQEHTQHIRNGPTWRDPSANLQKNG